MSPEYLDPFSRRSLLKAGLCGAAAGLLPRGLAGQSASRPAARARSVIQIWMWGGPSRRDTFDPKPGAGSDYTGPLDKQIPTNVDGVSIGQSLPLLAQIADKYAIIRSMTHGNFGHETAAYMVQTGRKPGGRVVFPCVGAVVARLKGFEAGYKGQIPPYVVLTRPQGRFSEAGFMGIKYKPFATGGDPARTPFLVEGIASKGISQKRQQDRRELLRRLNTLGRDLEGAPSMAEFERSQAEAYDLILGEAGKVFDLSQEKDELRDKYGRNTFGQSCLAARRLVESGVPYVTINYTGWDTHKEHFQTMRRKLPELDAGFSTLLADLDGRGLLDSTIVWWGGEFGRTPKVDWNPPWNGGRGHYGHVFSTVVAGGGFKGGRVLGASDELGAYVAERPVYPWDLIATMYALLGIDPETRVRHPQGEMIGILPSAAEGYQSGGRLTELT